MAFVLIEDGVVVQKQPYYEPGFIEAPDDVICGFLYDEETGAFWEPPPPEPEDTQD